MGNQARTLSPIQQYFLGRNMGMLRALPDVPSDALHYFNLDQPYYANGNEDRYLAELLVPVATACRSAYAALCFELLEDNPSAWGDYRQAPVLAARVGQVLQQAQAQRALDYIGVVGPRHDQRINDAATALNAILNTAGLMIHPSVVTDLQNAFQLLDTALPQVRAYCESKAA